MQQLLPQRRNRGIENGDGRFLLRDVERRNGADSLLQLQALERALRTGKIGACDSQAIMQF